jgi:TonB family protein
VHAEIHYYELQAPKRRSRFVISALLHVIALPVLVKVASIVPQPVEVAIKPHEAITWVPLEAPRPAPPPMVEPPRRVLAELRPTTPPVVAPEPKTEVPKPEIKPEIKPETKIETPKVAAEQVPLPKVAKPVFEESKPAPPAPTVPKRTIASAGFDSGSSAKPTVNKPAAQVQTGGFGDPNGVPARGDGKGKGIMIASLGSFDLPQGPGEGNGTGGARGVKGTVKDSGFGNGVAAGGHGSGRSGGHGEVASAGFADAGTAPRSGGARVSAPSKPTTTPVEIISKPKPAYTAEARKQKVEGEVLLQVRFTANRRVEVLRVVHGLGYGLDETAEQAARNINFSPATRDGQPYDSTAMVHIVFQLAE